MRIERAGRRRAVPPWALMIVAGYLLLIALHAWIGRASWGADATLCLFRRITDHACPTCGSTRMVLAALGGRVGEAAGCNPLMFALAAYGLVLLVARGLFGRRVVWITSARSAKLFAAVLVVAVLCDWVYLLNRFPAGAAG